MLENQVKSVMKGALNKVSSKEQVDLKKIRICLEYNEGFNDVLCSSYNGTERLNSLNWNTILGMKSMFKGAIVSNIKVRLDTFSERFKIEKSNLNVRIFAKKPDGTPGLYIYNSGKPIKEIDISELM